MILEQLLLFWFFFLPNISPIQSKIQTIQKSSPNKYYKSSKPMVRWFWFATKIKESDVKYQLDWAKKNNFGGVEIAWLYPLHRYQEWFARDFNRHYPVDTSAQKWLSKDWTDIVAYTKKYANSIDLSCDFTFGSAWPVAGLNIEKQFGTQIYGDTSFSQLLTFSWAWPQNMRVINHLDPKAFEIFAKPYQAAMGKVLKGSKSALFTDSWEIKLNKKNKIWTPGFDSSFKIKFGYDIIPYMNLGIDSFPDVRYDYMLHLDDYVTSGFYLPYVKKCAEMGAWSRVQCLGAPTDVMTTYSLVDIPETEAMLNNPNYSKIVSSAACLSSKKLISSESFTCLYGFPSTYLRKEQTADLKMVADALFANGVNQHVYCGMPYNPKGSDTIDFFATCYFGPGGSLTDELPAFNSYVEKVSALLQMGKSYSDVAVYIPYEDAVMKGPYPPERQRVWVWGEYEMRYIHTPSEIEGYHPLWINRHFLETAKVVKEKLIVGDAGFSLLYLDINYLDIRALKRILQLAKEGLRVCIKQQPLQPGKSKSEEYSKMLNQLLALDNVSRNFNKIIDHPPLIQGDSLPDYCCRTTKDGTKYLFLAQWVSKNLQYPVYSGQSISSESKTMEFILNTNGKSQKIKVEFKPYQSVVLKISPKGKIDFVDISFFPKTPIVRPREIQKMYF
ncbi:MAG: glycosyl hydrolase [Saprospiraceae bacterium]